MTAHCLHLRVRFTQGSRVIVNVLVLSVVALYAATASAGEIMAINNPYDGVSWQKEHRHKANFHTHTTNSDGKLKPHEVVDVYQKLGYSVLAITDHNAFTFPWTEFSKIRPTPSKKVTYEERLGYEDRDPEEVGMTSILGCEFSSHHHMLHLWEKSSWDQRDMMTQIENSKKDGGQLIFAHPGRYRWFVRKNAREPGAWSIERYTEMFREHEHFIGLEIYNQGDRHPQDRRLWDFILEELMPARPVWGFSNDDMHNVEQLGRNYTILLVQEPTDELLKNALAKGQFFYVYRPKGHDGAAPPTIEEISVDQKAKTISVKVDEATKIEWISDGEVVAEGPTLDLPKVENLGNYVRATMYGSADDTVIGTQPFGIVRKE